MTLDQLDELIRKYLSTGVAVVVVLVGPTTAPSADNARSQAPAATHSTTAPPTGRHAKPTRDPTTEAPYGTADTSAGRAAEPTRDPTTEAPYGTADASAGRHRRHGPGPQQRPYQHER
jgi:hypothetical protein